ncbi:MAG: FecR domain-containing protein [Deltaproteobacteria bacterium]|nr:FecR domain-containing protein [Deltaproteobacteria bacterium]
MSNLRDLGQRMAGLQDRRLAELRQETSPPSSALGEHLLRRSAERRRRRRVTMFAVAAVLVAGGAFSGLRLWPAPEPATVATVRAQAGQRVAASLLDLTLAFEDGSRVELSSGSSLRTVTVGPAAANLELERGRATVRVVHRRTTRWTVRAGSYRVTVTGTRFRVDWRPERGAFAVAVEEGSVRVSGGLLTEPVDVRAGQSVAFEQGRAAGAISAAPVAPEPPAEPGAAPSESAAPAAPPALLPSPLGLEPASRRSAAQRLAAPSWREQAEAGRYRDAMAEAERKGFAGICREAAAADLLTLAEAARYAGRSDRAEQALKTVRARFGRSDDAAVAAYVLGRIAAETRRDYADAARWFRAYLAEQPGGRLDREAEGRLLEALAFMDRKTAREAARLYLRHYPSGPHAAFARNLLGP